MILILLVLCAVFSLCYVYLLDSVVCSYFACLVCSVQSRWLVAWRLVARFARIARFSRLPVGRKVAQIVLFNRRSLVARLLGCFA